MAQSSYLTIMSRILLKGNIMKILSLLLTMSVLVAGPVLASPPSSWRILDQKSAKACIAQSGLRAPRVGPVTRFSDRIMMDVRTVEGRYPQKHMKRASAKMLCLYNRTLNRAEVQELNR